MFEPGRPLATAKQVQQVIMQAFADRRAFSAIRCGDGEAVTLGYPEFISERRFRWWMTNFFGTNVSDLGSYVVLQKHLADAIATSDVVGTFRERVADVAAAHSLMSELGSKDRLSDDEKKELSNIEWRILNNIIEPLISDKHTLTSTNMHIRLEEAGIIAQLIGSSKRVNIITGNMLDERLISKFPNVKFTFYSVPTEYKFEKARDNWSSREPHFPTVFNSILRKIQGGEFEGLTLVGAGPCGKVYCANVKKAGGFAIDIGSIMDLWAGRNTRSFIAQTQAKTLS